MSRIESLGRKSIAELDLLIAEASVSGSMHAAFDEALGVVDLAQAQVSFLDFLDRFLGINPALRKVIGDEIDRGHFPYKTVRGYLEAREAGRTALSNLQGMTQKMIAELEHLLAESGYGKAFYQETFDEGSNRISSGGALVPTRNESSELEETPSAELLQLSIPEFVESLGRRRVSARLRDETSNVKKLQSTPYKNLREYLSSNSRQEKLESEGGFSRRSVQELEKLLSGSLGQDRSKKLHIERNRNGYVDVSHVMRQLLSSCDERQHEVIIGRMLERKTLEEVAAGRSVTRERIRQIEARLVRSLWLNFGPSLVTAAHDICRRLKESDQRELTLEEFCCLVSCEAKDAKIFISLLKKFDKEKAPFGITDGHVYLREEFAPRESWGAVVRKKLSTLRLLAGPEEAASAIDSIPGFFVQDYVRSASCSNASAEKRARRRVKTSRMCIEVLRRAGGPLHTSEARARIWEEFQIDIEEHAINATMGRLREAVISAPGTYVLYEHLLYSDAQVERVRDMAHEYLVEKGIFLSSKILYDDVFASLSSDLPSINHYVVMGILQDDPRFVTKRGNMIGLMTFDVSEAYTPLQDEIVQIVISHGPVTLQEISARLSETRRLCNDSGIRLVLAQSKDVIQTGKRTYDALHRFFEDRSEYETFTLAIRLSLLDKRKTTYAIHRDLDCVGLNKATPQLIESIIASTTDISSECDIHALTVEDPDLGAYNQAIHAASGLANALEMVRKELREIVPKDKLESFIRLDARLARESTHTRYGDDHKEIDSILKDFGL